MREKERKTFSLKMKIQKMSLQNNHFIFCTERYYYSSNSYINLICKVMGWKYQEKKRQFEESFGGRKRRKKKVF